MRQMELQQYWRGYVDSVPQAASRIESYTAEQFGDSVSLTDELGDLILQGIKTVTCSALWE